MRKLIFGLIVILFCTAPYVRAEQSGVTKVPEIDRVVHIQMSWSIIGRVFMLKAVKEHNTMTVFDRTSVGTTYYIRMYFTDINDIGSVIGVKAVKEVELNAYTREIFEEGITHNEETGKWEHFTVHKFLNLKTGRERHLDQVLIWDKVRKHIYGI